MQAIYPINSILRRLAWKLIWIRPKDLDRLKAADLSVFKLGSPREVLLLKDGALRLVTTDELQLQVLRITGADAEQVARGLHEVEQRIYNAHQAQLSNRHYTLYMSQERQWVEDGRMLREVSIGLILGPPDPKIGCVDVPSPQEDNFNARRFTASASGGVGESGLTQIQAPTSTPDSAPSGPAPVPRRRRG